MFVQIDPNLVLGCFFYFFQRFALAAVELNGVLDATTGGFDGKNYLGLRYGFSILDFSIW